MGPRFNTAYRGTDIPATDEEWRQLTSDDVALLINLDGMLTASDLNNRSSFIRNHISMVRANQDAERQQSQMRIDVYGPVPVDDDRAEIRSRILGELQRRGLPVGSASDNWDGNGRPHDPPETA